LLAFDGRLVVEKSPGFADRGDGTGQIEINPPQEFGVIGPCGRRRSMSSWSGKPGGAVSWANVAARAPAKTNETLTPSKLDRDILFRRQGIIFSSASLEQGGILVERTNHRQATLLCRFAEPQARRNIEFP
jgi:hypothetical protein